MTEYRETIWTPARPINNKWIKITFKNGDTQTYNAEFIETVEYIEDK